MPSSFKISSEYNCILLGEIFIKNKAENIIRNSSVYIFSAPGIAMFQNCYSNRFFLSTEMYEIVIRGWKKVLSSDSALLKVEV